MTFVNIKMNNTKYNKLQRRDLYKGYQQIRINK